MQYIKLLSCALVSTIFLISGANARSWHAQELVCKGTAILGNDTISDEFVLRLSGSSIEIRGEPGATSTFDGTVYKVCFESQDEIDFEYTTEKCGTPNSTRFGSIQKVTGILKVSRKDMPMRFIGRYKCKPTRQTLD